MHAARRARELRRELTPAEQKLWQCLRGGQIDGAQFRRQHAVGTYIVDFFCAKSKLVIEVDGDMHSDQIEYDAERTQWLNEQKRYELGMERIFAAQFVASSIRCCR